MSTGLILAMAVDQTSPIVGFPTICGSMSWLYHLIGVGFPLLQSQDKNSDIRDNHKQLYLAIINHHYYGTPPKELTDLTRKELCFVTPVHSHRFIMIYSVGKQLNLKGTLSFFHIK